MGSIGALKVLRAVKFKILQFHWLRDLKDTAYNYIIIQMCFKYTAAHFNNRGYLQIDNVIRCQFRIQTFGIKCTSSSYHFRPHIRF